MSERVRVSAEEVQVVINAVDTLEWLLAEAQERITTLQSHIDMLKDACEEYDAEKKTLQWLLAEARYGLAVDVVVQEQCDTLEAENQRLRERLSSLEWILTRYREALEEITKWAVREDVTGPTSVHMSKVARQALKRGE